MRPPDSPIKVYAAQAGRTGIDLPSLVGYAALERGARILVIGLVLTVLARLLHPWLRRLYGTYLVAVGPGFAVGIWLVVAAWG